MITWETFQKIIQSRLGGEPAYEIWERYEHDWKELDQARNWEEEIVGRYKKELEYVQSAASELAESEFGGERATFAEQIEAPGLGAIEKPGTELSPRQELERVVSVWFAFEAEAEPAVIAFRRDVLGDKLISRYLVRTWIKRIAQEDAPPTARAPVLRYLARSRAGIWVEHCQVKAGGVLDRLRKVSEWLAAVNPWNPAQATTFVLARIVPEVDLLRVRGWAGAGTVAGARVELSVDAVVPADDVRDAYERARNRMLGRRYRIPSPKHSRLALFVAGFAKANNMEELRRTGSDEWRTLMAEWNRFAATRRKSCYENSGVFRRDSIRSVALLFYPYRRTTGLEGSRNEDATRKR